MRIQLTWKVAEDMIGRGWYIGDTTAVYLLGRDGRISDFAKDNYSYFWPTKKDAERFLRKWQSIQSTSNNPTT